MDVFAEFVVEDVPVDDHVAVHLDVHDVLDLLVDLDDVVVVDLLDLDEDHVVHVDVVDVLVDHLLADNLAAQDVSHLLVDLFLLPDDVAELLVADLDVQEDLPLLVDVLLVDEPALLDESALSLFVFDVFLSPEGGVADHDVEREELAGHDGDRVVHLDVCCRCQLACCRCSYPVDDLLVVDADVEVDAENILLHKIFFLMASFSMFILLPFMLLILMMPVSLTPFSFFFFPLIF